MKELDGQMKKLMSISKREVAEDFSKEKPIRFPVMTKAEFNAYSDTCDSKKDWQCCLTTFACKDYLCPRKSKMIS